jgi:hypothetical protein
VCKGIFLDNPDHACQIAEGRRRHIGYVGASAIAYTISYNAISFGYYITPGSWLFAIVKQSTGFVEMTVRIGFSLRDIPCASACPCEVLSRFVRDFRTGSIYSSSDTKMVVSCRNPCRNAEVIYSRLQIRHFHRHTTLFGRAAGPLIILLEPGWTEAFEVSFVRTVYSPDLTRAHETED